MHVFLLHKENFGGALQLQRINTNRQIYNSTEWTNKSSDGEIASFLAATRSSIFLLKIMESVYSRKCLAL
jgi:hypothetical protein